MLWNLRRLQKLSKTRVEYTLYLRKIMFNRHIAYYIIILPNLNFYILNNFRIYRFNGLFAPHWQPDARGTMLGISQYTSKGHICRATLEVSVISEEGQPYFLFLLCYMPHYNDEY